MTAFIEFWIAKAVVDCGIIFGLVLLGLVGAGVCIGLKKLAGGK